LNDKKFEIDSVRLHADFTLDIKLTEVGATKQLAAIPILI
jgi:hypothetical protein